MRALRRDPLLAVGALLLAAVLAIDIASLTRAPPLFGDEAWIGSRIASFGAGDGFYPTLAANLGIYQGGHDYWASQVGSLPFIAGELVGPSTFTFYRAISLFTALAGVAAFWLGLRRAHGATAACFGAAALVASWAFLTASHWIRWDSTGMLFACAITAILLWGPPRVPAAAALGLLIGLTSDFVYPMLGLAAGAALLVGWEREDRGRRLAALGAGVGVGLVVFAAIHVLPDPDLSREQFDAIHRPIYGETPVIDAVKHASLTPLLEETDRYELLLDSVFWRTNALAIATGLLAALLTLLALAGVPRRPLALAGYPSLGLLICATAADLTGLYETAPWLLDVVRILIFGLFACCFGAIVTLVRWGPRRYPRAAVGPILLVSLLLGFALLHAYKLGTYTDFAVPFAVAAVIAAAERLAPAGRRPLATAAVAGALTLAGGATVVDRVAEASPEPALDDELSATATEIVPADATVIGEWVYWWLYRDPRFQVNSSIWFQAYEHPGESFRQSFNRVCPDYVLLDDLWLDRYAGPGLGRWWPNLAPQDPAERQRLEGLLQSDYLLVRSLDVDDRRISFWHRRAPDCPAPG